MNHYPKWKYHAELEPKLVHSKEDEQALGSAWAETPAAFKKESEIKEEKAQVESSEPQPEKPKRGRKRAE